MTIKECVKKYAIYLKDITHIPAKEVEILIMHLLEKNVIWLHLNYDNSFTKLEELEKLVKKELQIFLWSILQIEHLFMERVLLCKRVF